MLSFLNQSKKVARAFIIGYALQGFKQILVELPSPIHIAAMYGLTYVTQRLLNRGTPADFRDSHGRTPLFLAAMYGYGNVVALLAPRDDVDVNAIDHKGHTPLDAAVGDDMVLHNFLHGSSDFYAQHKTIVRLLLEKGSRVPTFDTYLRNRRLYTDSKKRPSYSKWAKGQFLTETK